MSGCALDFFDSEVQGKPVTLAYSVKSRYGLLPGASLAARGHSRLASSGPTPDAKHGPAGSKNMSHSRAVMHVERRPELDRLPAPSFRWEPTPLPAQGWLGVATEKRNCPIPFNHQGKVIRKTFTSRPDAREGRRRGAPSPLQKDGLDRRAEEAQETAKAGECVSETPS